MINVLLLGATGTFGSALAKKLIADSECHVTLFARTTNSIKMNKPNVTVMSGDAANAEQLKMAVKGQDVVYCAISGNQLPIIAENLVSVIDECNVSRLLFMGAVGIYNELPAGNGAEYNVDNEPEQIPNRQAVDVIEKSNLNYTVLRPGFLQDGNENDYVLTVKGETPSGYTTTIPSVVKLAIELIHNDELFSKESVSITKKAL